MKFTDLCDEIIAENEESLVTEKFDIDGANSEANDELLKTAMAAVKLSRATWAAESKRITQEEKAAKITLEKAKKAMKDAIWQHDKAKTRFEKELRIATRNMDKVAADYDKLEKAIMKAEKKAGTTKAWHK